MLDYFLSYKAAPAKQTTTRFILHPESYELSTYCLKTPKLTSKNLGLC